MRLKSISFKLISSMLMVTTLILCSLGLYDYNQSKQRLDMELKYDTNLLISRLKLNLPPALWNINDEYISSVLGSEVKTKFIRGIYILNDKGSFAAGIEKVGEDVEMVDEMPANSTDFIKSTLVYLESDSGDEYGVGHVLLNVTNEGNIALLKAEVSSQAIQIATLNIILMLLFSIVISRITNPLGKLKDVASSIALGDYELDIHINRKDEIGELAESFTKMKEGIKKKVQDLRDLNMVGEKLAACTSQNEALEKTLHALSIHSHVQFGSIYLYNQNNSLELKCFYPPKIVENGIAPRTFENGEGILGLASQTREIIFIPNTLEDERFINDRESVKHDQQDAEAEKTEGQDFTDISTKAKAIICIPLVENNISLGVLSLSGNVDEVQFAESDYEFAETISRQLISKIKNIRMREVIEEQNRNLEVKVDERTKELRQKNRDVASMMGNMHQGLFTIIEGGLIHSEYAAFLEEIFETKQISERNFEDLLFNHTLAGSDAVAQNVAAVHSIVGEDEIMYGFNTHCLLNEMNISLIDGVEKILVLDWDPIISENGFVDKLMVTVRDITALKKLEAEAEEQKLELEIIGEILAVAPGKFNNFIEESHQFLAECSSIIETTSEKNTTAIANLFRSMHTIKGNARTYGLKHITDIVHDVESTYDELRKNEDSIWDSQRLLNELAFAEKIITRYEHVFRDKLGLDKEVAANVQLDPLRVSSWIERINDLTHEDMPGNVKYAVSEAYSMLISMNAKPVDEVISDVIGSANSLADQLGKARPKVKINNSPLLINSSAYSIINNIFMHIFRNALDHGIESITERLEKGKLEQGLITLDVSLPANGGANITIQDDGRGIGVSKIYELAVAKGIYNRNEERPSAQEIANLVLDSGFSTAETVTDVSGRGVGMDAVKGFLEKEGGSIEIILGEGPENTDFRSFTTNIHIPEKFYTIAIDFDKAC